ncbi:MAG: hypothetical protein WA777_07540, partial [Rhodanobacter sp.]
MTNKPMTNHPVNTRCGNLPDNAPALRTSTLKANIRFLSHGCLSGIAVGEIRQRNRVRILAWRLCFGERAERPFWLSLQTPASTIAHRHYDGATNTHADLRSRTLKCRESGMPEETIWSTFFDADTAMAQLWPESHGNALELGCGFGTFTLAAA